MSENWKPVKDYEGIYEVSDTGLVRSLDRVDRLNRFKKGTLKAPCDNGRGYLCVNLKAHGKQAQKTIHRLVATAFIPNPDNLPVINHIDGNRGNNDISNLEWCTQLENMRHAFKTGLIKHKPLTDEQKLKVSTTTKEAMSRPEIKEKIRQLAKGKVGVKSARHKEVINLDTGETFISVREASKFYRIHESNLASCCRGERSIAGGYHWKYIKEVV